MYEKVLFLFVCCCFFCCASCSTTEKRISDYGSRASEVEADLFELRGSQSGTAEANTEVGRHLETIEESVSALDNQIGRSEESTREIDNSLKRGAEIISEAESLIEGIREKAGGTHSRKRNGK